jgi:hypothetical protein
MSSRENRYAVRVCNQQIRKYHATYIREEAVRVEKSMNCFKPDRAGVGEGEAGGIQATGSRKEA